MIIPILCFIFILIAIPIGAIVALKTNKDIKKIDVTANMPLVENICRREFTNGYYNGILKQQLPRKNGTTLIEFYPTDVEQGENIPRPSVQSVVVKDEYIKRFAGDLSSRRVIIKLLGRSPSDYPKQMRDTIEGDYSTTAGQLAHIEATFGKAIPSGDEAIAEAMKTYNRGEVSKSTLAQIKQINEEVRRLSIQQPQIPQGETKKE